jgi:hypothetical protein
MWAGHKDKKGKNHRGFALGSDSQNLSKISWELMRGVFYLLSIRPLPLEPGPKTSHILKSQSPPLIGGTKKKWMFSSLLVEQAQSVLETQFPFLIGAGPLLVQHPPWRFSCRVSGQSWQGDSPSPGLPVRQHGSHQAGRLYLKLIITQH